LLAEWGDPSAAQSVSAADRHKIHSRVSIGPVRNRKKNGGKSRSVENHILQSILTHCYLRIIAGTGGKFLWRTIENYYVYYWYSSHRNSTDSILDARNRNVVQQKLAACLWTISKKLSLTIFLNHLRDESPRVTQSLISSRLQRCPAHFCRIFRCFRVETNLTRIANTDKNTCFLCMLVLGTKVNRLWRW